MSLAGSTTDAAVVAARRPSLLGQYAQLTKVRLSVLVVLTTAVGFVVATPSGAVFDWVRLMWTVAGTSLAAASASAFNQIWESARDRRMLRTRQRPLPARSMSTTHAFLLGMATGYAGLWVLSVNVSLLAGGLALTTIVLYVVVYTPLKTRTTLNTLVGAVCGAIPPMIGWVAAAGAIETGGWLLAGLLFVWQIPHFFALAWLYRDDYERGGFAMLPNIDRDGSLTGRTCVMSSLALVPVGLLCTLVGMAGWLFMAGSVILALWMVHRSVRFWQTRSTDNARALFRASLVYLTAVLALLLVDSGPLG
jgi:protoheme IX farnesyltransferase